MKSQAQRSTGVYSSICEDLQVVLTIRNKK